MFRPPGQGSQESYEPVGVPTTRSGQSGVLGTCVGVLTTRSGQSVVLATCVGVPTTRSGQSEVLGTRVGVRNHQVRVVGSPGNLCRCSEPPG